MEEGRETEPVQMPAVERIAKTLIDLSIESHKINTWSTNIFFTASMDGPSIKI